MDRDRELCTKAALAYNPVLVLGISAGAVALWLLVWALLFRGRLGLE